MPPLPLDYPEPFAATIGVMLYPGEDEQSQRCARSAAGLITSNAIRAAILEGYRPCENVLGEAHLLGLNPLPDIHKRHREGILAGHLYAAYFALHNSEPRLASWNNAIKILADRRVHQGTSLSRSFYMELKSSYDRVLHLWAAWVLRGRTLRSSPVIGFERYDDFQFFLFESEVLRKWGQTYRPDREDSDPPLTLDVWSPPPSWVPPVRGYLSHPKYPKDVLADLRQAGRPRKVA